MGRKFHLIELRKKFLASHEKYMRLHTDEQISAMSVEDLRDMMSKLNEISPNCEHELRERFKELQRTRTLALWHDHATLLGLGVVMITVHVVYDPTVFYTQSECISSNSQSFNLQSTIESPSIHMICVSSSSMEDQSAFLQDRIDCLNSLLEDVTASNGLTISDKLRLFVGDHPAQQFERGTQQGGKYKCGGCGVREIMMDDLAHTLQIPWRNLHDIQQIATAGKHGKQPGKLKPFDHLRVQQIREEFHARGRFDTDKCKDDLEAMLKGTLKGVQRVLSLLLLNSTGRLSDLNLEQYTVLDCEPLHDLKGHLINLCKQLPYLLTGVTRKTCEDIITATTSDKMTCADHRLLILQLYLHLQQQNVKKSIIDLLETAIRISQILYLPAESRTQCRILQLYNCSWLHHELCTELFTHFYAGMTKTKMFGSYLHALLAHAPLQLEIIPLSSINTENKERIFSQA